MIEAIDLHRQYGDFHAVQGVSFTLDEGEIVGILGPNGAGKTTTIRMITGFLPPTAGRVTVAGRDLFSDPRQARRELGYLPENVALYPEMRVEEYLSYRARLEGMEKGAAKAGIGEAIERCLLEEVRGQIIGTLSKGFRQRVGLAAAILHGPRVLVLDEPTVGLDPGQIIAIRELIRELGKSRTLLLSTHILPEVELLCDRVLIIDQGKLVAQGTPDELRGAESAGQRRIRIAVEGEPEGVEGMLTSVEGVHRARAAADGWVVEASRDCRGDIFRAAVAHQMVLLHLVEEQTSFEDIFVRLTTQEEVAEEASSLAVADSSEPESGPDVEPKSEADVESDSEEVPS
ncbi:MAG: ABC transporter ATP-binding protein [Acidobacteriota bacterium]